MTYPRAHLIDEENGGLYHVNSRCVRRAFLCGVDDLTGRDFNHRRQWIEDRILKLAEIFTVSIFGYAVMSSHYHVTVKTDPLSALKLSDGEVVERWLQLCPLKPALQMDEKARKAHIDRLLQDAEYLAVRRRRLGSLSWFMRYINEPLARIANKEDECTGRFWEGRFSSQAILDEGALLSCMVYVDLNPVRAGIASTLEESQHTSIKHRLAHTAPEDPIAALAGTDKTPLTINLEAYTELLLWTADIQSEFRRGFSDSNARILKKYQFDEATWATNYQRQQSGWQRALGSVTQLKAYAQELGLSSIRFHRKRFRGDQSHVT